MEINKTNNVRKGKHHMVHMVSPLTHGSTYSFGSFGAVPSEGVCIKRKGIKLQIQQCVQILDPNTVMRTEK
jgi:hypothetical protein